MPYGNQDEIVFCFLSDAPEKVLTFGLGDFTSEGIALVAGEGTRRGALAVDLDVFPPDCVVRTRREGDMFRPFKGGKKPLKKFLTDRKIPARLGHRLPVIAWRKYRIRRLRRGNFRCGKNHRKDRAKGVSLYAAAHARYAIQRR